MRVQELTVLMPAEFGGDDDMFSSDFTDEILQVS